jgi:hypothetical protein
MGVDIVVLAEHRLGSLSPEAAARLLEPTTLTLLAHEAVWRGWWSPPTSGIKGTEQRPLSQWTLKQDHAYGLDVLYARGPLGAWVDIGPRTCIVHPSPRWGAFVEQPLVQDAVTSFCTSVARALGATSLLYLPDSSYAPSLALEMLEDNYSLGQILDFLQVKCGPPATTISSIRHELSDDETRLLLPSWDAETQDRLHEYDGYFVANVA